MAAYTRGYFDGRQHCESFSYGDDKLIYPPCPYKVNEFDWFTGRRLCFLWEDGYFKAMKDFNEQQRKNLTIS